MSERRKELSLEEMGHVTGGTMTAEAEELLRNATLNNPVSTHEKLMSAMMHMESSDQVFTVDLAKELLDSIGLKY